MKSVSKHTFRYGSAAASTAAVGAPAEAVLPSRITVFSKPGCPHCARAKAALGEHGLNFEEIVLGQGGVSYSSLAAVTGRGTTPQVYVDGELIGSADELEQWLSSK